MKIRLLHDAGYKGLANVQFPVEVEVDRESYGLYCVRWAAISAIPKWFYNEDDAHEGGSYCFHKHEVELVNTASVDTYEVEKRITALRETGITLFPKLSEDEKRALLYIEDEPAVSAECCVVTRKDKLISLVRDYGEIITEGYKQDSLLAMLACHEEEKRLLKEIINMINEGV